MVSDRFGIRLGGRAIGPCEASVPSFYLSGERKNVGILRILADGAPGMNMMGTQIIGKFLFS